MIIISILLLLAPGAIAMRIAGWTGEKEGVMEVLKTIGWFLINNFLVVVFAHLCIYLMKGPVDISFSTEYRDVYRYTSIYFGSFVVRYGASAFLGAVLLGMAERKLFPLLPKRWRSKA